MANCVDRTNQTTVNRLALSPGPTVDSNGEFTLNQIDVFAQELANNILAEKEKNPIQIAVNRYGQAFYDSVSYVNGNFRNRVNNDVKDFPEIDRRWARGNITNLEFADFLQNYNYTPQGVIDQTNYLKLLRELNNYYKDSFASSILGGFCATMQNIFNQIDAFFDLIGVIDGIISDALAFIEKVRTFDGIKNISQQQLINTLIDQIKTKITDMIDEVFRDIQDAIENFDITATIGDIEVIQDPQAVKNIMTAREQMCLFFTDENKKGIKDKVKALIDYAVSLFENVSLEQIQFMVFRFCALATNIELLIKDIKRPLDDYGLRYQRIVKRLQAISNINTSTAIRNGAIRLSPEARKEAINRLKDHWLGNDGKKRITPTGIEPTGAVAKITAQEYKELPRCGSVWRGKDSRIKVEGQWMEDIGIEGYTRIDLDVKVYLMRIQAITGGTFTITKGWVNKEYNDKIGGDPDSAHLSGLVIDIKNDIANIDSFLEAAQKSGIKNIIVYTDRIHLDIRDIPR